MKLRILYSALTLLFFASSGIAQSAGGAQMKFAVLGGVNVQNLNGKDFNGTKLTNDMIIGFHAGVNVQIPIAPEFYFQPGLLFSTKGAKNTEGQITSTYKLSYVELPLNLVYKGLLGNGHIMVGFGPYVGYAIKGKTQRDSGLGESESDIEFKSVVDAGDPLTTTYFKAIDAGGNIFVGYELASGIFIQLNSQIGMLKINPEDKRFPGGETAVKNTGFGISAGYRF